MNRRFECGCIENAYWCGQHDIYSGKVPPWGAGSQRSDQMFKERENIKQDYSEYENESCTCFKSAPCSWCENQSEKELINQ